MGRKNTDIGELARALKAPAFTNKDSGREPRGLDPVSPTTLVLRVSEIKAYEHNPRHAENREYPRLKDSIRSRGGLTTPRRNVIWLVTPQHLRDRKLLNTEVRIVNLSRRKFFAYGPVDVLGYEVNMSDVEKTAIDCVDRPDLCGGIAEAAYIFGRACWKANWDRIAGHLKIIKATALTRKVGWLADHVGAPIPGYVRDDLLEQSRNSKSKTVLGPRTPKPDALGHQREWNLSVNVPQADLSESEGIARRHFAKKKEP